MYIYNIVYTIKNKNFIHTIILTEYGVGSQSRKKSKTESESGIGAERVGKPEFKLGVGVK